MPTVTHVPLGRLSPTQAAEIASRARKLLRVGRLSHHTYAVLDAILWAARERGADRAVVSYSRLQALAHVARATVAKAIACLQDLGLLQRVKQKVLVLWNNGGRAWRQMTNAYRLIAIHHEFTGKGEIQQIKILSLAEPTTAEARDAQEALTRRRQIINERLLRKNTAPLVLRLT